MPLSLHTISSSANIKSTYVFSVPNTANKKLNKCLRFSYPLIISGMYEDQT